MLQEDDVIVWVEERIYSISTMDVSVGNVLYEIREKLWTTVFSTVNQSSFLMILQIKFKRKFQRC